ncbi:MAG: peptide deformylase [Candidatus Omnitrophica bacterium]|nr:peptide deformylase [Candidatus Omnitrophota bacterium]
MEPLVIKKYPDEFLRKNCSDIGEITHKEKELFEKMLFTMKHFCGIGLAAPQIGISRKMIVAEVQERIIKLANPEVIDERGSGNMTEGCLSVPDVTVDIERPDRIVVRGLSEKGKIVEIKATGLLARVVQHEIDHLGGKLIIDYRRTK